MRNLKNVYNGWSGLPLKSFIVIILQIKWMREFALNWEKLENQKFIMNVSIIAIIIIKGVA